MLKFSEVVVATMTATASVGQRVDLDRAYETAALNACVIAVRNADASACKPDGAMKLGSAFGRSVALRVKAAEGRICHVKVFDTGNLQISGARSLAEAVRAAAQATWGLGLVSTPFDVRVRMLNASMHMSPPISRGDLARSASQTHPGLHPSFDPCVCPSTRFTMCFDTASPEGVGIHDGTCKCLQSCATAFPKTRVCARCTIRVYRTGTIVFSGACLLNHVLRAAQIVKEVIALAHPLQRDLQICGNHCRGNGDNDGNEDELGAAAQALGEMSK